jgi:hypothetical protein
LLSGFCAGANVHGQAQRLSHAARSILQAGAQETYKIIALFTTCCPLHLCTLAPPFLQAIDPELGGSATASLDTVVAKLARAKAGKGYASAREALLLNGRFVLAQVGREACASSWRYTCEAAMFMQVGRTIWDLW